MKKEKKQNFSLLTVSLIVIIVLLGTWTISQIIKDNKETRMNETFRDLTVNDEKTEQQEADEEEKRLEYLKCIIEFMKGAKPQSASEEKILYDMSKDMCQIKTNYKE